MSIDGVPAEGLKTVGQIVATNSLTFQAAQESDDFKGPATLGRHQALAGLPPKAFLS